MVRKATKRVRVSTAKPRILSSNGWEAISTNLNNQSSIITTPLPDPLVPPDAETAYVNKGGNDATWVLGDRSKPFLTIQAALNTVLISWTVRVEDGVYTENITMWFLVSLVLSNVEIVWDISASFGGIYWDKPFVYAQWQGLLNKTKITWDVTALWQFSLVNISLFTWNISGVDSNMINVNHIGTNLIRVPASGPFWISWWGWYFENVTSTCSGFLFSFDQQWSGVAASRDITIKNCEFTWDGIFENWDWLSNIIPLGRNIITSTWVWFNWDQPFWSPTGSDVINLDNCSVNTTWYLIDFTGNISQNMSLMHSVIRCWAAENINWASWSWVINLKEGYVMTQKEHNTLGKVNYVTVSNHTTDSNL